MLYVNLNAYLSQVKAIENSKPVDKRRAVPTVTQLAEAVGIHQTSLSRIANNRVSQLNLDIGSKIIAEMRRRGFGMQVGDLLVYMPEGKE